MDVRIVQRLVALLRRRQEEEAMKPKPDEQKLVAHADVASGPKDSGWSEMIEKFDAEILSFPEVAKRLIASLGSIEEAARLMKTSYTTMCRWKDGEAVPRDAAIEKDMRELVNGSHVDAALIAKYDKTTLRSNHRLKPDVIAAVKRGMAAHPESLAKGGKVAQINKHDYAILVKLVTLSERHDLPTKDREEMADILSKIERNQSCISFRKRIREIISNEWKGRMVKRLPHVVKKEQVRFDMTIINVEEVCNNMSDMTIPPDLSDIQRDAAIVKLMTSVSNITDLVSRLVGGESHD